MRRLYFALAALAVVAVIPTAAAAPTATRTVTITRTAFTPSRLTIKVDDRVTWTNKDTTSHQVVSNTGAFASPILAPGKSYSFTFRDAGTYAYHDALHPSLKGTVVVTGPPPSLSIALSPPILRFGDSVTLTAQVSAHRAGETVVLIGTPYGGTAQTIGTFSTDANGIVTTTTQPQLYTTYEAKWKSLTSQQAVAQVRPKLSLLPYEGRLWIRVTGARSFAGRYVYLQRLSAFSQWVSVAKYALGSKSGRIFNRPRKPGTYRVYMTVNEAGLGYLDGWSGTQKVKAVRRR